MTVQASILGHLAISWFDSNRLGKVPGRKGEGVKKAVVRFGDPLAHLVRLQMTIIARSDRAVAGFHPGVVVGLHDVTVCACAGIILEISSALSIPECEHTESTQDTKRGSQNRGLFHSAAVVPGPRPIGGNEGGMGSGFGNDIPLLSRGVNQLGTQQPVSLGIIKANTTTVARKANLKCDKL